jgi:hypothetical protein
MVVSRVGGGLSPHSYKSYIIYYKYVAKVTTNLYTYIPVELLGMRRRGRIIHLVTPYYTELTIVNKHYHLSL